MDSKYRGKYRSDFCNLSKGGPLVGVWFYRSRSYKKSAFWNGSCFRHSPYYGMTRWSRYRSGNPKVFTRN